MEAAGNKDLTSIEAGGKEPPLRGAKLPRLDEEPSKDELFPHGSGAQFPKMGKRSIY